jgi:hypothetical protein
MPYVMVLSVRRVPELSITFFFPRFGETKRCYAIPMLRRKKKIYVTYGD